VDEGTNGLDDAGSAPGIDDPTERETSAPYPFPLRGIRIVIRVLEPDTKEVRQVVVHGEFLPD
jgi:hypothetical protein